MTGEFGPAQLKPRRSRYGRAQRTQLAFGLGPALFPKPIRQLAYVVPHDKAGMRRQGSIPWFRSFTGFNMLYYLLVRPLVRMWGRSNPQKLRPPRRPFFFLFPARSSLPQQLRQFSNIRRDAPRHIADHNQALSGSFVCSDFSFG